MNIPHILTHLALADFRERTRRYSFLLILAAIIIMGILVNNGTLLVDMGSLTQRYRGEFNSAWIGMMTALVINCFLGLFGFYLVSDCIERDIRTGVGQIIATTPLRRVTYLMGKWISNCLVLFVLVGILAAAAVIMVLLKHEAALDLGELLMPFFAIALPFMVLIAAFAVVFQTVPWLRGALGNVAYFFLWIILFTTITVLGELGIRFQDPIGYNIFSTTLTSAASAAYPSEYFGGISIGINTNRIPYKIFTWQGLDWSTRIVMTQWVWGALGLGLILLSALWFARFDPSRTGLLRMHRKRNDMSDRVPLKPEMKQTRLSLPTLSPLVSKLAQTSPFMGVLLAELRMLLKGRRWWWWALTIGLNIAVIRSPVPAVMDFLMPVLWLWPIAVWSGMGNRERKHHTSQMVFSSARPVMRQLPAAWLAGILVTALLTIAGAVFFLTNGDLSGLAGWAGAVVFVPSLALLLGVLSSGSRVFEVIYVIWWYMGPIEKVAGVNYTLDVPHIYLLAAVGLLLLSAAWRNRQVRV
jgi:hypothetical protein